MEKKSSYGMKGKKHSEEAKKKMSEAKKGKKLWLGKKHTKESKQKMSKAKLKNPTRYWLRKKRDEETIKKMSIASTGRKFKHTEKSRKKMSISSKKGKEHWNWQGGISEKNDIERKSLSYKLWREKVFKRDKYTCQKCKKVGGNINPHHIENFSDNKEKRFKVKNGITLCEKCHRKFHKKYYNKNNNIKQIKEFLEN